MRLRSNFVNRIGGLLVAGFIRRWMGLLDYQFALYDVADDPIHPDYPGPAIFLMWHEYLPVPFYVRGHCNIAMLISQHQDAEWLSHAARHLGFSVVRGSTNRGGISALREMLRSGHHVNLAMAPDGPRGPRRQLATGPVYLSSRLRIPLICVGVGYHKPWRNPWSWDKFAVPRPFSRARLVFGPRVQILASLDRDALEDARRGVEQLLNQLTTVAERWAESGAPCESQMRMIRQGTPWWHKRAA
jgi:lysophospholipid acyltransferase (LPLAT)-like uncharacterized protein